MQRRYLLPGAVVAFVAAAGLFFFASEPSIAHAQPASPYPSLGSTSTTAVPVARPPTAGGTSAPTGSLSSGYPTVRVPPGLAGEGKILFDNNCSSCHGVDAAGSDRAPNLLGVGAATVDFWVSSGRMPLSEPAAQAVRKPPRFNESQTHAIVAYVTSLAPGGPGIPKVDLSRASLAAGGDLFALNCAGCHTITGVGDALSNGTFAPTLYQATTTQIAEAVRTGPGQMPRFGPQQMSPQEVDSLVAYVKYLRTPNDAGGGGLGHVGPVTEGFIGLLIGLGGLMLVSFWIGDRA
jgi:ubiquinol-cytochrome c reductase cytochrome c subunit